MNDPAKIRQEHLAHEQLVSSITLLIVVAGLIVLVPLNLHILEQAVRQQSLLPPSPNIQESLINITFQLYGISLFALAWATYRRNPKARKVAPILIIPAAFFSLQSFLIAIYIVLWFRHRQTPMIFSKTYRDACALTPEIPYKDPTNARSFRLTVVLILVILGAVSFFAWL